MRAAAGVLALATIGCGLTTPARPGDGGDGGPIDATPSDAFVPGADASPIPSGAMLGFYSVADDLDRDGADDLVTITAYGAGGEQGVLIDWGEVGGGGFGAFDTFLPTPGIDPLAIAVTEADGSPAREVVLFGVGSGRAWILVFGGVGVRQFLPAARGYVGSFTAPGSPEPGFVLPGYVSEASLGVFFGTTQGLWGAPVLPNTAGTDVDLGPTLETVVRPGDEEWVDAIQGAALAGTGSDGRDDLLVVDGSSAYWLYNVAGDNIGATGESVLIPSGPGQRTVVFGDLDNDTVPDVVQAYGNTIHYVMTLRTGDEAQIETRAQVPDLGVSDGVDALAIEQFGDETGDPDTPDVIVLDLVGPSAELIALPNVRDDGAGALAPEANETDDTTITPAVTRLATGDFDGDGVPEIRVFNTVYGAHACRLLTRQLVPELTACPQ